MPGATLATVAGTRSASATTHDHGGDQPSAVNRRLPGPAGRVDVRRLAAEAGDVHRGDVGAAYLDQVPVALGGHVRPRDRRRGRVMLDGQDAESRVGERERVRAGPAPQISHGGEGEESARSVCGDLGPGGLLRGVRRPEQPGAPRPEPLGRPATQPPLGEGEADEVRLIALGPEAFGQRKGVRCAAGHCVGGPGQELRRGRRTQRLDVLRCHGHQPPSRPGWHSG